MGHMAKDTLTRAGSFLVFLPLAHSLATAWYFTLLTGEIRLSDAFPWLFQSFFLFTGLALPVYRFTRMKATPSRAYP